MLLFVKGWRYHFFYIRLFVHSCFTSSERMLFYPQAEWVALNYVPFAERSLEVMVDLYHKTACHKAVINEKVLQNIIKVCDTAHQPTRSTPAAFFLASSLLSSKHGSIFSCLFIKAAALFRFFSSLSRFWFLLRLQVTSDPKAVVTMKLKRAVFILGKNVQVMVQTNHSYTLNVSSKERTNKLNIGSI